ncbi:MAG: DUF4296 domain-containing protein [Bacteroidales bacterium]|nr:DUF4296 domain-containing protein [Bacteroidales bacterium]
MPLKFNNIKYEKILITLAVLAAMSSCFRDPKPRNTLSREKFIEVLADIHIAEAVTQDRYRFGLDSLQSKDAYLSVLKKHKIEEQEMVNTTLYYSRHPREFDKIYTEVISRMERMSEEISGKETDNDVDKKGK